MAGVGLDYGYFKYLTDGTEERTIKCNTYMASLLPLDLDAPDLTKRPFPAKKARAVYVQDAAGRTRTLIVGSPTAFAALDGTAVFALRDPGSAATVNFNLVGKRPEEPEKVAHVIANQ